MVAHVLTDNTGTTGEYNLTWTDVEKPANFYGWRAYWKVTAGAVWTKTYETLIDSASYDVDIYAWANALPQDVTVVGVSQDPTTGELTETTKTPISAFTPVGDAKYTLVHPTTPALSVILPITSKHSSSPSTEHQVIDLMDVDGEGGGRKVNVGTIQGRSGQFSVQLRLPTTTVVEAEIEALYLTLQPVWLRDPFGGLRYVALDSVSSNSIAGMGPVAGVDMSISYMEVIV